MTLTVKVSGLKAVINSLKTNVSKEIETKTTVISKSLVEELKDATPIDTGEAREGWVLSNIAGNKVIENDVSHISVLNEGHSSQAPSNFIEKTLLSRKEIKPNGIIARYKEP